MIIEIILIIIILFALVEGFVIWNLMNKVEFLETWIEDVTERFIIVQDELKEIDSTGHFEADDEIGSTFKGIQDIVNSLSDITENQGEEENAKKS